MSSYNLVYYSATSMEISSLSHGIRQFTDRGGQVRVHARTQTQLFDSSRIQAFVDRAVHCDVIIVDPGRGFHAKFTTKMLSLGYSHIHEKPKNTNYLDKKFKGWIMTYSR